MYPMARRCNPAVGNSEPQTMVTGSHSLYSSEIWQPRYVHIRIPLQTGVERKATCRALFSKLLYLAESEELLPGADAGTRRSLVADVFGATEDDAAQLRIVSLYEVHQIRLAMHDQEVCAAISRLAIQRLHIVL